MKIRTLFIFLALLMGITAVAQSPKREFRGAWIQCVNGQFQSMSADAMKNMLVTQLDVLEQTGINAIIFQIRAEADALYQTGAAELFLGVETVVRKLQLPWEGLKVSYSGGLFKAGECILSPLRERIEARGGVLAAPVYEPDAGAVLMAIRFHQPEYDLSQFALQEEK